MTFITVMGNDISTLMLTEGEARQAIDGLMEHKKSVGPAIEATVRVFQDPLSRVWRYKTSYSYDRSPSYVKLARAKERQEKMEGYMFDTAPQALFYGHRAFREFNKENSLQFYVVDVEKYRLIRYESQKISVTDEFVNQVLGLPTQITAARARKGIAKDKCFNAWQTLTNKAYYDRTLQGDAERFVALVRKADGSGSFFQSRLNTADPAERLTLFVPNNQAVGAFLKGRAGNELGVDELGNLLSRHILKTRVSAGDLPRKREIFQTLNGEDISLERLFKATLKVSVSVNGRKANVLQSVETLNGYVHVIDQVILGTMQDAKWEAGQAYETTPTGPADDTTYQKLPSQPPRNLPEPLVGVYSSLDS